MKILTLKNRKKKNATISTFLFHKSSKFRFCIYSNYDIYIFKICIT